MNRAKKRRQRKLADKAADDAKRGNTTIPSPGQQTPTLQQSLELALRHHTAGHLPEAESIYRQILQADPDQSIALHLLGVIAHQEGKNDVAVDLITQALAIQPDDAEAHNNLGLALRELGRRDDAVVHYRKALAIKPDYADAHNNLGNTLYELNKLDEAVASYHEALAIKPDYAEAHCNLGNAFKDLGKLDEAVASYHKGIAIKPDLAEAHYHLGNTLKELNKLDEAVASFHKALAVKPDHIEAYFNRGYAAELQEGKEPFDPQLVLDQCFAEISLDNYSDAMRIMHNLCLNSPYNTRQNIKAFIDRWCEAIIRMLDNRQFDIAGKRIRWLYMHITNHKPFDALMQRYFDETKNEKPLATLEGHEKAVHLSMQSQYFYQNGHYDEAEECAKRCVNATKALLENEAGRNDGWLLVKKSLKNIKDSENARGVLERLLIRMD